MPKDYDTKLFIFLFFLAVAAIFFATSQEIKNSNCKLEISYKKMDDPNIGYKTCQKWVCKDTTSSTTTSSSTTTTSIQYEVICNRTITKTYEHKVYEISDCVNQTVYERYFNCDKELGYYQEYYPEYSEQDLYYLRGVGMCWYCITYYNQTECEQYISKKIDVTTTIYDEPVIRIITELCYCPKLMLCVECLHE